MVQVERWISPFKIFSRLGDKYIYNYFFLTGKWPESVWEHPENTYTTEETYCQDWGSGWEGTSYTGERETLSRAQTYPGTPAGSRGGRTALHISTNIEREN